MVYMDDRGGEGRRDSAVPPHTIEACEAPIQVEPVDLSVRRPPTPPTPHAARRRTRPPPAGSPCSTSTKMTRLDEPASATHLLLEHTEQRLKVGPDLRSARKVKHVSRTKSPLEARPPQLDLAKPFFPLLPHYMASPKPGAADELKSLLLKSALQSLGGGAGRRGGPPPPAQVRRGRLPQGLHQELAPQGAQADAHRREAIRVRVGGVRVAVRALGRADAAHAQAHRPPPLRLPALPPLLRALRPPRPAHAPTLAASRLHACVYVRVRRLPATCNTCLLSQF